jgi:hypothetical protein
MPNHETMHDDMDDTLDERAGGADDAIAARATLIAGGLLGAALGAALGLLARRAVAEPGPAPRWPARRQSAPVRARRAARRTLEELEDRVDRELRALRRLARRARRRGWLS